MVRQVARGVLGAAAVGFACLAYAYLTLPDVRPLRTSNPDDDGVHRAARARSARQGADAAPRAALGRLRPHLRRT